MSAKKTNYKYHKNIFNPKLLKLITIIEEQLKSYKISSALNIELEGVYNDKENINKNDFYDKANKNLARLGIKARLKPEFWHNQWEYENNFKIGNITSIIDDYYKFINNLDNIFYPQQAIIEPIIYNWQKLTSQDDQKAKIIHVPNAMQINLSLWQEGYNLLANKNYAYYLQNLLIKNSINNLIFFIPNQLSLDRLFLRNNYDLKDKLMSPQNISGGNQGSIACYLELNKKNLDNKLNTDFTNLDYNIKNHQYNWQKYARIEFRLASASLEYNPYLHICFIMIIILESIISYDDKITYQPITKSYNIVKKFYADQEDNLILRYQENNFCDKKISLFSNKIDNKKLLKHLTLLKQELEELIRCIIN